MARPPVAKLMDYGKFKYESALKARESRKNQAQTVIKEIKLRPKIDPHDYGTKKGHVERFLKAGDKVKVTIMFRGREQSRPELGFKLLQRLASDVEELGFVESTPKQDGRNMIMVIGPHKRKTDAMAQARAERASRATTRASQIALDDEDSELDAPSAAASAVPDSADDVTAAPSAPAASRPAPASTGTDSASTDSASTDSGSTDSGSTDSGSTDSGSTDSADTGPASTGPASTGSASPAATPRPATPRPQPRPGTAAPSGSAAPKPSAPRTAASPAGRPGAGSSGGATPRPTAPRGASGARTTAGAAASSAPRPASARQGADGPVPSPRTVAAGKSARPSAGPAPAETSDSES
jgi:translation initiation factor IF-3